MARRISEPLENDSLREAVHSMRGYNYQILRSVLAWINLPEDQVLYLEGAEDFDELSASGAVVTQVKDTALSGSITLRSRDVVKAIGNYWNHKNRNISRSIAFRFLTTAQVGQEVGNPFGSGVRGLDLWHSLADATNADTKSVDEVRTFLIGQPSLDPNVQSFLSDATVEGILDELIRPMRWHTGSGDSLAVAQQIRDKLVLLGQSKGIAAADADRALALLHEVAWNVATKERDRCLTCADFVRIFDQAALTWLPRTTMNALIESFAQSSEVASIGEIVASEMLVGQLPPLPPRYFKRNNVVEMLFGAAAGAIVIQGATGTGKTIAATAYSRANAGLWGWIDLRGLDGPAIRTKITALVAKLSHSGTGVSLVLDDLDASIDPGILQTSLASLNQYQNRTNSQLVITTARDLPPRVCVALDFDAQSIIRMPSLSESEIATYLLERGCPVERATNLARIVEMGTSGHPQLVHARVAALEKERFPAARVEELLSTPRDVSDVKAEAQRLLRALEPSARELAYRVSLTVGGLTRKRLMAIAQIPIALSEPGHAIDALIGPWLEVLEDDKFRLSPLIRGAGGEVQGGDWAERTHRGLAISILQTKVLNTDDFSAALLHGLLGKDDGVIVALARGSLALNGEAWSNLASAASLFVHVGIERPEALPVQTIGGRLLFRLMQYRLALGSGEKADIDSIVHCINLEFPPNPTGEQGRIFRFMFLTQVLGSGFRHHVIGFLVEALAEHYQIVDSTPEVAALLARHEQDHEGLKVGGEQVIAAGVVTRLADTGDLDALARSLSALPPLSARAVSRGLAADEGMFRMILDRVWLTENGKSNKNWPQLFDVLSRLYQTARASDWSAPISDTSS